MTYQVYDLSTMMAFCYEMFINGNPFVVLLFHEYKGVFKTPG